MGNGGAEIDISRSGNYDNVTVTLDKNPIFGEDKEPLTGYIKVIHTPKNGYTIGKIKNGNEDLHDFPALSTYLTISVYFWCGDSETIYGKPLIVQMGEGGGYYVTSNLHHTKWMVDHAIKDYNLIEKLDMQNCNRNSLHVVDIGKTHTTHGLYQCSSCSVAYISLRVDNDHKNIHSYTKYIHRVTSGGLGNIRHDDNTIHASPFSTEEVNVYWYELGVPTPLLFCYHVGESHNWITRYSGDTFWTVLEEQRVSMDDNPSTIQKTLQYHSTPRISIDVSRPADVHYQPTGNLLSFMVDKLSAIKHGFHQFTHSRADNENFKVKSVLHGDDVLHGISSEEPLSAVTAFYDGDDPGIESKLLMVELVASENNEYIYYSRPMKMGENWIKDDEHVMLKNDKLKTRLEALKSLHGNKMPAGEIVGIVILTITGTVILAITGWKITPILQRVFRF